MQIILRADVDSLGRVGDIVTVKDGFARNYLLPQGLAMLSSAGNLKHFELERKRLEDKAAVLRTSATDLAEKIAASPVEITVRVGEGDKLYGSVTTQMIADALNEKGFEIDKRKIMLGEPVRSLGEYEIDIKLHADVRATLKLSVLRHGLPEFEEIKNEDDTSEQPEVQDATDPELEDNA